MSRKWRPPFTKRTTASRTSFFSLQQSSSGSLNNDRQLSGSYLEKSPKIGALIGEKLCFNSISKSLCRFLIYTDLITLLLKVNEIKNKSCVNSPTEKTPLNKNRFEMWFQNREYSN